MYLLHYVFSHSVLTSSLFCTETTSKYLYNTYYIHFSFINIISIQQLGNIHRNYTYTYNLALRKTDQHCQVEGK